MQLTDKHLADLQAIYADEFGVTISKEQAYDEGIRLIRLLELIRDGKTRLLEGSSELWQDDQTAT